jgi:hypothetical protein
MKNPLLLLPVIAAALLTGSCKKSDIYKSIDGCPVSTTINSSYLNDAKEIVYQRILSGEPVLDSGQPVFNQDELNRVLSAIQSVYALHTPLTDSIFNVYQIHTFKTYVLDAITLQVDVNSPEIKNLVGDKATGNPDFDGLMAQYGFSYNGAYPPSSTLPFMDISSNTWYNLQPLVNSFKTFSFIHGAQSEGSAGDGNNITYQINGNMRTIDFSYGFGDCPAGCGGRIIWEFSVDQNCKATYVKTTGK